MLHKKKLYSTYIFNNFISKFDIKIYLQIILTFNNDLSSINYAKKYIELLYLNSTFQKYVISHCIAIGQQFQSSSSKSNCILVFHRAGTETKTSQGTLFKSLGHDFISVKTTYSYFSTQRR